MIAGDINKVGPSGVKGGSEMKEATKVVGGLMHEKEAVKRMEEITIRVSHADLVT